MAMPTPANPYRNILVDVRTPRAYITMNRPEKRNALSLEHMEELTEAFNALGDNSDVGVVILRGNGPAFCAGHDLSEMVDREVEFYRRVFDVCVRLMETIQRIPQPVIAQVHGVATAAGCQLVATCDLAVASEAAWFSTPGVRIGLFCSTPGVALSRAIGRKKTLEMLYTGDRVPAAEACTIGLINKVVPAADLESATETLAAKILESSRLLIGIGKQAFYRQADMPQDQAYAYTKEVMSLNATVADAHEGITAFLDKRAPHWKNR